MPRLPLSAMPAHAAEASNALGLRHAVHAWPYPGCRSCFWLGGMRVPPGPPRGWFQPGPSHPAPPSPRTKVLPATRAAQAPLELVVVTLTRSVVVVEVEVKDVRSGPRDDRLQRWQTAATQHPMQRRTLPGGVACVPNLTS